MWTTAWMGVGLVAFAVGLVKLLAWDRSEPTVVQQKKQAWTGTDWEQW